ncbi:GNAT family N-acetyltransferase [Streptomyces sp. JJ66]|uniref:GNAT family N-acetyltransferase n=1 Tax=Streptomyces sp. JJ66 TaxID=2803843 RepID=UPI001C592AB9|nr:GNAT family N-acetyltransferase [Streptomyces sp. JJ66]MBW1600662.1 GNAT family N-acetyltransferase [Streptomyces sp. JJ66]
MNGSPPAADTPDAPATLRVTTWSLEQTAPDELRPVHEADTRTAVRIERAGVPSPEFSRFLYTAVGGDVTWTDRLGWDHARWRAFLERAGTETWVAWERGTPAGFVELDAQPDGVVEISYFGLLPAFRGRGLGGRLLSVGTARAWDLAARWPQREPTRRVWLHTCSKDGPHALRNYERRGFRVFDVRTEDEPYRPPPGPWPGAFPAAP